MEAWRRELYHHGIKGQKWGVRRGPPYPLGENQTRHEQAKKVDRSAEKSYASSGNRSEVLEMGKQAVENAMQKVGSIPVENLADKLELEKETSASSVVRDAIESGEVSSKINPNKQRRHLREGHLQGRSYLDGDLEYAQQLVDQLGGTGKPLMDKNGNWLRKERVEAPSIIGTYVDSDGAEEKTNHAMIVYSKTGSHIYPRKKGTT